MMAYVPPRNDAEEAIASIWANLLGVDQVGAEDDFFSLGGDSILGIQIVSQVETAFGVRLSARAVFDAATVSRLAKSLPPTTRVPGIPAVNPCATSPSSTPSHPGVKP